MAATQDIIKNVFFLLPFTLFLSSAFAWEKAEVLPINSSFLCAKDKTTPYGWSLISPMKDPSSYSFRLLTSDDGNRSIRLEGKNRYIHYCYNDSAYPFEDYSCIELVIRGSGQGNGCCGLYCYSDDNEFLQCIKRDFNLSQKTDLKIIIPKPAELKNRKVWIRVFAGCLPNSVFTLEKISARKIYSISADTDILDDFKNIQGWTNKKNPPHSVMENNNAAMEITLPSETSKVFFGMDDISPFKGSAGIRFRVKNNGRIFSLPVAVCGYGSNSKWRYQTVFPVDGASSDPWQMITLYWDDFLPPPGVPAPKKTHNSLQTNIIGAIIFGDEWNITHCNRKIEPFQIVIDDLEIIRSISEKRTDEKGGKTEISQPFNRVIDKMVSGLPVHIMCCGDSITAGNGVKSPDSNRYGALLQKYLRQIFNNPKIEVEVTAVGGASTYNLRVWAKRDFYRKKPDLVIIHIGYNDKSQLFSVDYFKSSLSDFIRRVMKETEGGSSFLLLTTIPGVGMRYTMMDDFADAVRNLAVERKIVYYDLARDFKNLEQSEFRSFFGDMAHPNNVGHIFIASKIAAFFESMIQK